MKGLENVIVVMAVLLSAAGALWLTGNVDQWIQKRRGARPDQYGRVPDGPFGKILLVAIVVGLLALYIGNGWLGVVGHGSMRF